jgi:hypothetical protein
MWLGLKSNFRGDGSGMKRPVKIYKNGSLLKECESIQEAGRVLKEESGDKKFRFAHIERGYLYGDSLSYNSATYTFTTDKEFRIKRVGELEKRNEQSV